MRTRELLDAIQRASGVSFGAKAPYHLSPLVDFSLVAWNTVAKHEVFTVTGAIRARLLPIVELTCVAGAGALLKVGDEANTAALIANTDFALLTTGSHWLTATPAKDAAYSALLDRIVSGGLDLGFEVTVAALTAGQVRFHLWWEPLSADANVVAAAGGVL